MDYAIPIVFPDYLIMAAQIKRRRVDLIPYFDFDNVQIRETKLKVPDLGHAAMMIVQGSNGLTKYFEYGRYDKENKGLVRAVRVPDAKVESGKLAWSSLKTPLARVSKVAGQGGRIEAVLIETAGKFGKMLSYAQLRMKQNSNPKRTPYDLTSHSCLHFVKAVVEAGGASTPWMLDPRPNSYIGEFQDDYRDLRYDPRTRVLSIEAIGSF